MKLSENSLMVLGNSGGKTDLLVREKINCLRDSLYHHCHPFFYSHNISLKAYHSLSYLGIQSIPFTILNSIEFQDFFHLLPLNCHDAYLSFGIPLYTRKGLVDDPLKNEGVL